MKVLFLGAEDRFEPWYSDVVAQAGRDHEICLFDRDIDPASQFVGVRVVIDQGGAMGTPELIRLAHAAGVELWQVLGTGLDHVEIPSLMASGMTVTYTPGAFSAPALAEHAMFLMLALTKQMHEVEALIRRGVFYHPMNGELAGKTLGIVGLGASGQELGRRASSFGMRVIAVDLFPVSEEAQRAAGVAEFGDLDQLPKLLHQADVVSLHLHLTEKTSRLFDAAAFAQMKPGALIINVARGGIVDEDALLRALQSGQIGGAGLDVFTTEPLSTDHPLLALDNVVATPHIAGMTTGTSWRRAGAVIDNVRRLAVGEKPTHLVTELDWIAASVGVRPS